MAQSLEAIDDGIEQTHRWIDELLDETDWEDRDKAYIGLRAVLLTIRDRLSVEEAALFGAELPTLLRGVYFEGWRPGDRPQHVPTRREFLRSVSYRLTAAGEREDAEALTRAVFRVLARNLPAASAA